MTDPTFEQQVAAALWIAAADARVGAPEIVIRLAPRIAAAIAAGIADAAADADGRSTGPEAAALAALRGTPDP